jgi:hypothetical protein
MCSKYPDNTRLSANDAMMLHMTSGTMPVEPPSYFTSITSFGGSSNDTTTTYRRGEKISRDRLLSILNDAIDIVNEIDVLNNHQDRCTVDPIIPSLLSNNNTKTDEGMPPKQ